VRAPENTQVLFVSAMRRGEYAAQSPRRRAAGDLGIRYLAAVLRARGVQADVLPDHQNTPAALEQRLRAARGLVLVGFSLHISTLEGGLASIAACRRVRPDVPVVVGGYHPTFAARALDEAGVGADYVVRGEGETPTVALVEALAHGDDPRGIRGMVAFGDPAAGALLGNEQRGVPQDLDALPLPLRTADDMPQDTAEVMVSASRGCYGSCTFCSVPVFGRAGWRGRDPNRVADEVDLLRRRHGARFVDFVDDSLFGPRDGDERARMFHTAFASLELKIPFRASIRPNDINAERITLLKECGLAAVQLGVESFSPRQLQEVYHKRSTSEAAIRAVRLLESAGIHVQIGLILFEPTTTLIDLQLSAEVLTEEPWAVTKGCTSQLFAAEGTKLARRLVARGESLGLDNYLNHRWAFEDPRVARVYEALCRQDRAVGDLGAALLDAITPPQEELSAEASAEIRSLQNRYQRASFRALHLACRAASDGASSEGITATLEHHLAPEFDFIRQRAELLLTSFPFGGRR